MTAMRPIGALPAPTYRTDGSLTEFRTPELFVVAAARLWVAGYLHPEDRHHDWRAGFGAAGIDDNGIGAFEALFQVIASATTRQLDFRCQKCTGLGADEGWLLQALSALQHRRDPDALAIFSQWMPPTAVRIALRNASIFAEGLAGAGLTIPRRHVEAGFDWHSITPCADRGLELVQ